MQSAEEFLDRLSCLEYLEASALIRARDREIVEACKEILRRGYFETEADEDCAREALDSVLRDLG